MCSVIHLFYLIFFFCVFSPVSICCCFFSPLFRSPVLRRRHRHRLRQQQQGEDSVEYFLGLTPSGIVVLRDKTTVAYYYWPRITKVYFKGRYFMLRVCDKSVSSIFDFFPLCLSPLFLAFVSSKERINFSLNKAIKVLHTPRFVLVAIFAAMCALPLLLLLLWYCTLCKCNNNRFTVCRLDSSCECECDCDYECMSASVCVCACDCRRFARDFLINFKCPFCP